MKTILRALAVLMVLVAPVRAQAVLETVESVTEGWLWRTTTVTLGLSAPVPFAIDGSAGAEGRIAVRLEGVATDAPPAFAPGVVIEAARLVAQPDGTASLQLRAGRALTFETAEMRARVDGGADLVLAFAA
ncbi:hypothetical protein, partial [Roseobacter sp. HKCCA0434]|uniref:hypothetical protein n=1 Tax=Roseobacter sp. HKCCA0434 TaxID=3079297 RepID=UPI002905D7F3